MKITVRDAPPRSVWALQQAGVHPLLAQLFAARGVLSADELDDGLARLLPPSALHGAHAAAVLLADAALRGDWPAYAERWAAVDALAQAMLLRQDAGERLQLTLCGERRAQTFESAPLSWLSRLTRLFPPKPLLSYLENL